MQRASLEWGDLLLIMLMSSLDIDVSPPLQCPRALSQFYLIHRPVAAGVAWILPVDWRIMASDGPSCKLQSRCSLSSSWTSLPSGARMSVRCSGRILDFSLGIGSMNLPVSLWRNTSSSLTLPCWECICYLSPRGRKTDFPLFLL